MNTSSALAGNSAHARRVRADVMGSHGPPLIVALMPLSKRTSLFFVPARVSKFSMAEGRCRSSLRQSTEHQNGTIARGARDERGWRAPARAARAAGCARGQPRAPAQDPRAQGEEAGGLGGHQPGRAEHARHHPRAERRRFWRPLHRFRERGAGHGAGRQGDAPAAQRAGDAAGARDGGSGGAAGSAPGETRQTRGMDGAGRRRCVASPTDPSARTRTSRKRRGERARRIGLFATRARFRLATFLFD